MTISLDTLPNSKTLANVQNYLLLKGHACPTIDGDRVKYVDRTRGHHRIIRVVTIESILEEIRTLKQSEASLNRMVIDIYQVGNIDGKLLVIEDLPLKYREKENQLE